MNNVSKGLCIISMLIFTAGCTPDTVVPPPASDTPHSQEATEIPTEILRDVPFVPQAPFADWNPPYDEACEEASLIMVERYLQGTSLTRKEGNAEIQALVAWQSERGYRVDITIAEVAEIAEQYYGRSTMRYYHDEVTIERIKEHLAANHPVIIPAAGQHLNNPYFKIPGPPYHMLVIIGYTKDGHFITNDPGTRRGEHFLYPEEHLLDTIHDWTGAKETITQGKKAMLVVY